MTLTQAPAGFVPNGRHPLSAIFGDVPPDRMQDIVDSILANGRVNHDEIICYEGKVLDGWKRHIAHGIATMRDASVKPLRYMLYEGDDPVAFVMEENLYRTHLSETAQAMVYERALQAQGGMPAEPGRPADKPLQAATVSEDEDGEDGEEPEGFTYTREDVAEGAGTSVDAVNRSRRIERTGQGDEFLAGEVTQAEAQRQADEGGDDEDERPPRRPRGLTATQRLEAERDAAYLETKSLRVELDDAKARIRFLEAEQRPEAAREAEFQPPPSGDHGAQGFPRRVGPEASGAAPARQPAGEAGQDAGGRPGQVPQNGLTL